MERRVFLTLAGSALAARPAGAAPRTYRLDPEHSFVAFTYTMNGTDVTGRMKVRSADIALDLNQLANSSVTSVIDAASADAGPFFATSAMKGQSVLDTNQFPDIRFRSESITGKVPRAKVTGQLTVRDVTRQTVLDATLTRQRGLDDDGRTKLSVLLTGSIDRHAFGASGYSGIVAPEIRLQILTRIVLE